MHPFRAGFPGGNLLAGSFVSEPGFGGEGGIWVQGGVKGQIVGGGKG